MLLNHVDSSALPGGFVGVDIFFVISGFLITSIIVRDLGQSRFSFAHFYARRARRLIPAATVMTIVSLMTGYVLLLPKDFKDLGASAVAYTAMCSNFLFWRWGDYFAGQHKIWPLLHTWSLAVEEQFYLGYPFLLWMMARWRTNAKVAILATLLLASFCGSCYQAAYQPRAAYFLLPSRGWELMMGALCAFAPPQRLRRSLGSAIEAMAFAAMIAPMAAYGEKTPFPGAAAIPPVLGAAVMVWMTGTGSGVSKTVLSWPLLVSVGRISYSLYLWHWPLLMFSKYAYSAAPESYPLFIPYLVGLGSIAIAWLSWRFIEQPGRIARLSDWAVIGGALAASGVVAACGLVVHQTRGMPGRFPDAVVRYAAAELDMNTDQPRTSCLPNDVIRHGPLELIGSRDRSRKPSFVLFGDSHADAIVPLFDTVAKQYGQTGIALCRCGTFPLPASGIVNRDMDLEFPEAALERLEQEHIPCVIIASFWAAHLMAEYRDGNHRLTTPREKSDHMKRILKATIQRLLDAGTERVWLVRQGTNQPFHVPRQLALDALHGRPLSRGRSKAEEDAALAAADEVLASCRGKQVFLIDIATALHEAVGDDLLTNEGWPAFCDDDHLSVRGSLAVRDTLDPLFEWLESRRLH